MSVPTNIHIFFVILQQKGKQNHTVIKQRKFPENVGADVLGGPEYRKKFQNANGGSKPPPYVIEMKIPAAVEINTILHFTLCILHLNFRRHLSRWERLSMVAVSL